MQKSYLDRWESLLKSLDVVEDEDQGYKALVDTITELPPMRTELRTIVNDIATAAGKGSVNLSGVGDDKDEKLNALRAITKRVAKGGAAYYDSVGNRKLQKEMTFAPSAIDKLRGGDLYMTAKEVHRKAVLDGANYIRITLAHIEQLDADKEAYFEVIPETKREIEDRKIENDKILPLLQAGGALRERMDLYMQTFSEDEPDLYSAWEQSMGVDNTGAHNPAALEVPVSVPAGETVAVDYDGFELQNDSEIKLINPTAAAVEYGFGSGGNFSGTPTTVAANDNERKTAVALGYHSIDAPTLYIRHAEDADLNVTVEFYEMP